MNEKEILDYLVAFNTENRDIVQTLMTKLDQTGLATFGIFLFHLNKNCKVKDFKLKEFQALLLNSNVG